MVIYTKIRKSYRLGSVRTTLFPPLIRRWRESPFEEGQKGSTVGRLDDPR